MALWISVGLFASLVMADIQTEQTKLLASDREEEDELGESVSVSGAAAFIGAPGFGRYIATRNRGAVYVFGVYLFADGFESGDTSSWSEQEPPP